MEAGLLPRLVQSPLLDRELMALRFGEQGQVRKPVVGTREGALQQDPEMAGQTVGRRGFEEVHVVAQGPRQTSRPTSGHFPEVEGEVELRRPLLAAPQGRELQPGYLERRHRSVLEHEHGLEDRRLRKVALRLELGHQLLERQILVRIGVQGRAPGAAQQLAEAGIAREVRAQGQGVEEEPDQPLDLGAVAVRDRRADREVLLAGMAAENGGERGEEDHKGCGSFLLAQLRGGSMEAGGTEK